MAKKKAGAISVAQLRSAVEKAVKAETTRGVSFDAPFQIQPGMICGRLIRGKITLDEAKAAADRITKAVSAAGRSAGGPKLTSAVLVMKNGTTCGFFPTQEAIAFER